jgi:hypothetical protein
MSPPARRISVVERHANVGLDYDRAGERYRAYADGDLDKLYDFDGQYGYGDREIWNTIVSALHVDDLSGLDLFHCRFASDPQWNPAEAAPTPNFLDTLRALESRFRHNPSFIDHATHLLMVAHPQRS